MNFLAIDTSGKRLVVLAGKGEEVRLIDADAALQHSVLLFPKIEEVLISLHLTPQECDFFACVTGPGSFTGIRIGIAAVKGLCMAAGKPALPVTSFEALAYAEKKGRIIALVDAGHDFYYACGYENGTKAVPPQYLPRSAVEEYISQGFEAVSSEPLRIPTRILSPAAGLLVAAREKRCVPPEQLEALYLRKSSAEERR